MLKIYYGNEATKKQKFIFDHIDTQKKTIIIVPDQFSLQMERDILEHFRESRSALLNIMVTDFSSLGYKVVRDSNGAEPELIDKYGRHMLLSLIIDRLAGDLSVYKKMSGRNSFTSLMNSLISEMKRYGTSHDDIANIAKEESRINGSYLEFKLEDIEKIYGEYEKAVEGKYLDSEDYIKFYGDLIMESELVSDAEIWVYGFDTFTPLNILLLQRLLQVSDNLHIVMDCEYEDGSPETPMDARALTIGEGEGLFDLTKYVIKQLVEMADEIGASSSIEPVTDVRESAFAPKVCLAETSNIYAEAERAAAYILEMVRDHGYRFGDIALICNDMDIRGKIIARTFHRWGIPAFADQKRKVLHQPVVRFLLSLLDVMVKGFVNDAIMSLVKTGLLGWNREDEELLQNYVAEFRINANKWKKTFTLKGDVYTDDDLQRLNEMRAEIVDIVMTSRDDTGRRNTASEKVQGIYDYLENRFGIRDRIGEVIAKQNEMGLAEGAAETAQSWNLICSLFTQIVRVVGDEKISNETLRTLIGAGLEEAEIGLVPQSADQVLIGTMQRTRISKIKVLMVIGANEGLLPVRDTDTGLLTDKELEILEDLKVNITKRNEISRQEEQLAIYRNLSLPTDRLYVSYSMADESGRGSAPSFIYTELKKMADSGMIADAEEVGDLGYENAMEKITTKKGTLSHMAGAMGEYVENGQIDPEWLTAIKWYDEHDSEDLNKVVGGLRFSNRLESLGNDLADALYCGDSDKMFVSASRLERYSECPFKHFVDRGLKADEQRVFEIGGREIGDVYHDSLMRFSRSLMPSDNKAVNAAGSPWMDITREQCTEKIREIITSEAENYREGIFDSDAESRFRRERMIEICSDVAWALVNQVRNSSIRDMRFEEPFGFPGNGLPPIEVMLSNGKKAVLRGKIDRLDILDVAHTSEIDESGNYDAVSVVDYKSGNNKIDTDKIKSGYKLQLMVYMNAARNGTRTTGAESDLEPAGVFYFKIREHVEDTDKDNEKLGEFSSDKLKKAYKLEGIAIDDPDMYNAFDPEFYEAASEGAGCQSTTIPVKYVKKNTSFEATSDSQLLSPDEFKELCTETEKQVERICREIYDGKIDIAPRREKNDKDMDGKRRNACTFCGYRSICMFDTSFDGCRYVDV